MPWARFISVLAVVYACGGGKFTKVALDGVSGATGDPSSGGSGNRPPVATLAASGSGTVAFDPVEANKTSAPITITLTNAGGTATSSLNGATISGAAAASYAIVSDGCAGVILQPDASCTITVVSQPTAAGTQEATLTVSASVGGSVQVTLTGVGLAPPQLVGDLSSPQIFAATIVGNIQGPLTLTITNAGGVPTSAITAATLSGANPTAFSVSSDGCANTVLDPNETCAVLFAMTPDTTGQLYATLQVSATAGGSVAIALQGEGLPVPQAATLSFDMSMFPAGIVPVGSTASQTFTLTNVGDNTAGALAPFAATGPAFSITGGSCASGTVLGGGSSCTVAVTFAPAAWGAQTGGLAISASPGGTAAASFTGTGSETFVLDVNKVGPTGSVTATGINCDALNTDCTQSYTVTTSAPSVSLTATPASGARFGAFSGACSGATCNVTMNADRTVTATFVKTWPVSVNVASLGGGGAGTITSTSAPTQSTQLSCTTGCSVNFDEGATVTLTFAPSSNHRFIGWSGACSGTGACVLSSLAAAQTVTAQVIGPPIELGRWIIPASVGPTDTVPFTSSQGLTGAVLARVNLTEDSSWANAFMADTWPTGAIDTTRYFSFSVTAPAAKTIYFSHLRFSVYNSQTGSTTWAITTGQDGHVTPVDTGSSSSIAGSGSPQTCDLSSLIALSPGFLRSFRFYTYNNSGTAPASSRGLRGNGASGEDVQVWGVLSP